VDSAIGEPVENRGIIRCMDRLAAGHVLQILPQEGLPIRTERRISRTI